MTTTTTTTTSKRILVFGGRHYADEKALFGALYTLQHKHGAFVVVHGGATGADALAAAWARWVEAKAEAFPVDWTAAKRELGERWRSAGPRRNAQMIAAGLDGAVGFPGGRGTADMARQLQAAGVPVWWPVGGNPR